MKETTSTIKNMYLLRNNTFLNQLSNMDNNVYKVTSFILAKLQIQLQKQFPELNIDVYYKLDDVMKININIDDLKSLGLDHNLLFGKGLTNLLTKIRNTNVEFISYITGKLIISGLVAEFQKDLKNRRITAFISKEVFMFLLDYNLKFRKQYNTEDLIEINPKLIITKDSIIDDSISPKETNRRLPKTLLTGYSKIDMKIVKEFKSYYTQIMFIDFKSAIEKNNSKKIIKSYSMRVNYTIEKIRNKFKLENKYKKYSDLKKNVIDTFVNEINKSKYMEVSYIEIFKTSRGGKKVVEIEFYIKILNKLLIVDDEIIEQTAMSINEDINENKNTVQTLISKIYNSTGKRLSENTITNLFNMYGEFETTEAINKLCIISDKENKIKAPKAYLIKMLDNDKINKKQQQNKQSHKKDNSFFNFQEREYDYDYLEKVLTGEEEYDGRPYSKY